MANKEHLYLEKEFHLIKLKIISFSLIVIFAISGKGHVDPHIDGVSIYSYKMSYTASTLYKHTFKIENGYIEERTFCCCIAGKEIS